MNNPCNQVCPYNTLRGCTILEYPGEYCPMRNMTKEENKPLTNGDRIRAMSDEELAWNLIFRRDYWIDWETPVGCYSDQVEAHRKTVAWLKQPAEEET